MVLRLAQILKVLPLIVYVRILRVVGLSISVSFLWVKFIFPILSVNQDGTVLFYFPVTYRPPCGDCVMVGQGAMAKVWCIQRFLT